MRPIPTKHPISKRSEAIVAGLERAKELRFTKDYDIAIAIKAALENAGFAIHKKRQY